MKHFAYIALLCTLLTFMGCPKNAPKFNSASGKDKDLIFNALKLHLFRNEWLVYECSTRAIQIGNVTNVNTQTNNCGGFGKNQERAMSIRNQVLDNSIGLIDSAYGVYIRNIRNKRSVGEFLADLLLIGGNTSVGIVNGERALQVLGVALTGASGVRKSASLNFFDEKTTNVLIKQMDSSRYQMLSEIKQQKARSADDTADGYSFDAALTDLVRYFEAGTLNRAFVDLDTQTTLSAEVARKGILRLKDLKDVSEIISLAGAKTITDLDAKLTDLERDILLTPDSDSNRAKIRDASAFLKSVYDKMVADTDFAPTIGILRAIPVAPPDLTLTPSRQAKLVSATGKITAGTPLDGGDYYSLIIETISRTVATPALNTKLLQFFNEAKEKK